MLLLRCIQRAHARPGAALISTAPNQLSKMPKAGPDAASEEQQRRQAEHQQQADVVTAGDDLVPGFKPGPLPGDYAQVLQRAFEWSKLSAAPAPKAEVGKVSGAHSWCWDSQHPP